MSNNINISEAHVIRYMLIWRNVNVPLTPFLFFFHIVGLAFVLVRFVVAVIRE